VVGRQPNAPAAFTPGEIPGTHFQRLSRPRGTWFCRGYREKIPSDNTGNRSRDRPTSSALTTTLPQALRSQPAYCTAVYRVTIPDAVIIQFDLLKMSIVLLETCRGL